MNKQLADLKLGLTNEEIIHKELEEIFGELKATKEKYGKYFEFDKYNNDYFIEIKTRRIKHNQYNTLFFGQNKYLKAKELLKENPDLTIIYLWSCNDGIYGWIHDSSPFNIARRGRCDRGRNEIDLCIDIKQQYIKPLHELIKVNHE